MSENMTQELAIDILVATASAWAENTEERFARRVSADMTDDELRAILTGEGDQLGEEFSAAVEVRDVLRAIKVLRPGR